MFFLFSAFSLSIAGLVVLELACLAASIIRFRRAPALSHVSAGMTLIKPIRGLDENLAENLSSIVDSDPHSRLQVLIAMESTEDPAHAVAAALKAAHPRRDIEIVITGPSGQRMGKIHNMIEALARAKYDRVIFSDADVRATPRLVAETAWAFDRGCDAVFALPYHAPAPGLGGWAFMIGFNHYFCVPAALNYYAGNYRFCAGAWMAYTKAILEKAGGLRPLEQAIADDFAISDAVSRAGAKKFLLRELAWVSETGQSPREALAHLAKWAAIIRSSVPRLYALAPLASPVLHAAALFLACAFMGRLMTPAALVLAAAMAARALIGLAQDRLAARTTMAWWGYVLLAFADLGAPILWASGFRSRVSWRGKKYHLLRGGRVEVI